MKKASLKVEWGITHLWRHAWQTDEQNWLRIGITSPDAGSDLESQSPQVPRHWCARQMAVSGKRSGMTSTNAEMLRWHQILRGWCVFVMKPLLFVMLIHHADFGQGDKSMQCEDHCFKTKRLCCRGSAVLVAEACRSIGCLIISWWKLFPCQSSVHRCHLCRTPSHNCSLESTIQ